MVIDGKICCFLLDSLSSVGPIWCMFNGFSKHSHSKCLSIQVIHAGNTLCRKRFQCVFAIDSPL